MRRIGFALCLILFAGQVFALQIEDRAQFGPDDASQSLTIISTADISFISPLIESFVAETQDVSIDYIVASSAELMRALEEEVQPFDIAISSAMDLQVKLANDGRARTHRSDATRALPDWAIWNDMVFAFTQEPAAIVLSRAAFGELPIPENRQQLITTLRNNPEVFRGRVGTYDVRDSGLGYLFATQDARSSETYWRLTEVMGSLDAKLYCCSSDMIDEVVRGELAIAYNVLGSYAEGRSDQSAFTTILPSDFTTVMLRSALIPQSSQNPAYSEQFIDHLLDQSFEGGALRVPENALGTRAQDGVDLRPIELGPALLVYLDRFKNRSFIEEWESAILR
ncbi:MAG: ABC transporter substrate-binding protein [Dinoroseobacter sp.]|nr:ABC transporter substrate-binding protein [Dinoroseobacter sp.]